MKTCYLVYGGQFGDEGKAKVVDYFLQAKGCKIGVRFNGGPNAGHTIRRGGSGFIVHSVPVAATLPNGDGIGVIGPYCVIMPLPITTGAIVKSGFVQEVEDLKEGKFITKKENLFIDGRCNLILPHHLQLETETEKNKATSIGTTMSGIAPAYAFLHWKNGVTVYDCLNKDRLQGALRRVSEFLKLFKNGDQMDHPLANVNALLEFGEWLQENAEVGNAGAFLETGWRYNDTDIVYEGAQGVGLDILEGTVPFATSSFVALPELAGWVPPQNYLERVMVLKGYTTRVGDGPFPTEIFGELADKIRKIGNERGATTGRDRRVGWFDVPLAKHGLTVGRATSVCLTKLDVLTGIQPHICYTYQLTENCLCIYWPADFRDFFGATSNLERQEKWTQNFFDARDPKQIPSEVMMFISEIQRVLRNTTVRWLSTGPDTMAMVEPF